MESATSCTNGEAAPASLHCNVIGKLDVENRAADCVSHPKSSEGAALDWLGRPATEKHGGFKTSLYILVNQGLWNVANYAVASNLVLYFKKVLQMSNASAANHVTNWFGTMWMLTLLGGFAGDCYWGRFWTCVVFQIIHIVVSMLLKNSENEYHNFCNSSSSSKLLNSRRHLRDLENGPPKGLSIIGFPL